MVLEFPDRLQRLFVVKRFSEDIEALNYCVANLLMAEKMLELKYCPEPLLFGGFDADEPKPCGL